MPKSVCVFCGSQHGADPVHRRGLAVRAAHEIILHALALAQAVVPGPLDGRDVHERVGTATIRLNEPVAFGGVEPLHSSGLQRTCPHVRRETTPGNHAATQGQASPSRSGPRKTALRLTLR